MADKKKPPRIDLKSPDGKFGRLLQIGGTAIIVLFAVGLVFYIVTSHQKKQSAGVGPGHAVRVTSGKLVTQPGTSNPKVVLSFYEDFLCPACGNFERSFGPTVSKLVDIGAVAADYTMIAFLSSPQNQNYSARAAAAAYCVADESLAAFRRFHEALYDPNIQPREDGKTFPDNAKLIEIARESGAGGKVPDCINSGKYISMVDGLARAENIRATPTVKFNGNDYQWSTPDALVAKVKEVVGNVPGIDALAAGDAS